MLTRRSEGASGSADGVAAVAAEVDLSNVLDFRLGSLCVQPSTLQVSTGGSARTLERRVMQVLVALTDAAGAVVSRDRLVDLCWGGRAVSEDAINRAIAKVRRLGSDSGAFGIETIPRVGYRLVEGAAEVPPKSKHRGTWSLVAAAVLLVALAALVWNLWGAGEPTVPSIAVAEFTPLNADPDAKLYAESVSTSVSNALVATGATLASADRPFASFEDARGAGAALLVKGAVRRQGETIRVTAEVQSARTGATILTKDFEAPAAEAASLPDRVAAALSSSLWLWIDDSRIETDPAITEEILRIENSWDNSWPRSWGLARDLARANPNSATAQANFAFITGFGLSSIPLEERKAAIAAARESASRATRIRPEYGYITPCLLTPPGVVLTGECDKALRRAVAADPEPPYASVYFASHLAHAGRVREAATLFDNALSQSPYDAGWLDWRMFTLQMERPAGDDELPAIRARAQRYAPDTLKDEFRYRSAVANGNFTAAKALLDDPSTGESILTGAGKDIVNSVFRAVRTRSPDDAAAARRQCLPPPPEWNVPDVAFGTCLVGLTMTGDLDSFFALAQRGYPDLQCCSKADQEKRWLDSGSLYYPRVELWGSAMAPARADRRFIEIARRTGLLAYWKSGHPPDFCGFERAPVCQLLSSR